jgi:phosphoribosyl 1,2-cyclic phosphate phosphodiesterase
VGGDWGVCDPNEPKNRRSRCSLYVEYWEGETEPPVNERTTVLIDTSPDLREQCLKANVTRLDALLYTHDHADQSHGIDDLRAIAYRMRKRIPTYMDAHTKEHVYNRFEYCFEMPEGRVHPPILDLQDLIKGDDRLEIEGAGGTLSVDVLELSHGPTPSLGFIFGDKIAYSPDVWDIPEESFKTLQGVDTWIMDALRYNDHPTHAHADKALSWLAKTKAKHGVFTNLHIDMDYHILKNELFGGVRPAYDGMDIRA